MRDMLVTLSNSLDEVFEVVSKYTKEREVMEEDFNFIPTTVIEHQQSKPDQKKVGFACFLKVVFSSCTFETRAGFNTNHESKNVRLMTSQPR